MKTKIGIRLDDRRIKPDLDLLDRYLSYSAELLRLALLGIAGYAFLLKEIVYSNRNACEGFGARLAENRWSLIAGVILLGLSAALALQHRIFATDSAACMVHHLRYRAVRDEVNAEKQALETRSNLKWSERFLVGSSFLLGLGTAAVVYAFVRVLWP